MHKNSCPKRKAMLYRTNSSISVEYPTFGIASACGKAKKKKEKKRPS